MNTSVVSSISAQDLSKLHGAIDTGEPLTIINTIESIDLLARNFKENILQKLDKECKNVCLWGEPSELRKNKFCDMAGFEWQKLSSEMSARCPFLFDVFLTVMDKSKKEIDEILPRLGLCYAILMQTRNSHLSLVQRLNTVLLTHGNAKKEVCSNKQPNKIMHEEKRFI